MKRLMGLTTLAFAALISVGCNDSTPGGPGAPKPSSTTTTTTPTTTTTTTTPSTTAMKPAIGNAEETFTMSVPVLSTSLKQGEAKTATISLSRGKNFDEDVTLKFEDLPKGLTIDPPAALIKHGDKEANLTLKAADDAALGDFTIKVTGHPAKGTDAKAELKVSIDEK